MTSFLFLSAALLLGTLFFLVLAAPFLLPLALFLGQTFCFGFEPQLLRLGFLELSLLFLHLELIRLARHVELSQVSVRDLLL